MAATRETAGVIAPPPLIALAHLLVGLGLDALWPAPFLTTAARVVIAALLIVPGLALALRCVLLMRRAGTAVEPWRPSTALVTTGPYRRTRNPIYLAMVIVFLGLAFAIDSLWLVALTALLALVLDRGVIAREERYLKSRFGDAYRDYRAGTRRWL